MFELFQLWRPLISMLMGEKKKPSTSGYKGRLIYISHNVDGKKAQEQASERNIPSQAVKEFPQYFCASSGFDKVDGLVGITI
jgi:hypothetical protein